MTGFKQGFSTAIGATAGVVAGIVALSLLAQYLDGVIRRRS